MGWRGRAIDVDFLIKQGVAWTHQCFFLLRVFPFHQMGSGIIYYEIEKCKKYEDCDERADSDLAIVKTQRYHFDDEPFVHPLHSIHFDPDRSYELAVESLLAYRR
ncbi:hypothetical protein PIB30_089147 [Stylosanthes scabra]|uniref:Uncharacterized protein n=1 Tax=Stylosanthes scabra TaxID=79078 RepID=A0ABU6XQV8_9FABA|nr:hypothetical protein [Stylosanthes scabra]